jgi:DNA sulfur modification protein DndD
VTLPRMMPFAPDTYVPGETSYIPSGIGVSDTDYNRERFGVSLAGQWKSKDGRLSATAQYNRSQYDTKCFREAVVARHVERIERLVLESFRSLVRKPDLIAALRIDPLTFSLAITGGDGGELRPDQLSAGERQLLAVALLWGMARASGRPLPTVIDTPLGRLDSEHRSRLVERYFPHASHQVILLSTDEEISGGYHAALKPWIGRSYHLAFDPVAGRTVIQDGYLADGGLRHVA